MPESVFSIRGCLGRKRIYPRCAKNGHFEQLWPLRKLDIINAEICRTTFRPKRETGAPS
jgi:hypothetical protein